MLFSERNRKRLLVVKGKETLIQASAVGPGVADLPRKQIILLDEGSKARLRPPSPLVIILRPGRTVNGWWLAPAMELKPSR